MNLELLLEAERRGILPPDKAALLAEARKRGLVPGGEPAPAPKGIGQRIKENLLGDDDPTTQNMGEKVGSFLNKAGEAMTFGLIGDEASAAVESMVPGVNYADRRDHYRNQEAILERDNPGAAFTAEIGGALAGALTPGGAMGTLARGAGLGPRIGASMAAGGAGGATYGFMEGEGLPDRQDQAMTGAGFGLAAGAVAPVVGAGVQKVADHVAASRAIREGARNAPSSQELRALGRSLYDQVDNAGVQIKPESFGSAREKIVNQLLDETGFDPLPGPGGNTPKAARVVQTMDEMVSGMAGEPTAALPFKRLDQVRRRAASPMLSQDPVEQSSGAAIVAGLDDYVRNLGADDVVAGDIETLKTVLPKARDVWARMSRSQLIDDAIGLGDEAYLSGGGTGIKYQFKRILKNPKLSRGFTEAERKAMARVVNGTIPERILRFAGSGLAQIGGTVAAATGGGAIPALGVLGATTGARALSDKVIERNAEIARALVANGRLNTLPVASDQTRRIVEALMRRTAGAGPQ